MKLTKVAASVAQELILDNDVQALVPEFWALEALYQLKKMSVGQHLVYRDFEPAVAQRGETVNAYLPADFKFKRKGVNDDVQDQDAVLTPVAVKLDQHIYISFIIKDGQESKSARSLVDLFLIPAMRAQIEGLDQIIMGQVFQFMSNRTGKLGTDLGKAALADLQAQMTTLRIPGTDRYAVLDPFASAALLADDSFVGADKVGDDGTALREGSLGRKYGSNFLQDLAIPRLTTGSATAQTNAVNLLAGYAKGYTGTIAYDGAGTLAAKMPVEIGGYFYQITVVGSGVITLDKPLEAAVADNAVINSFAAGAFGADYAEGYDGEVVITGLRKQVGEGIVTAAGAIYTVIDVADAANNKYLLDRPLVAAVTNNSGVYLFPNGTYNFALHPYAMALVTRPLAAPREGTGALSAVVDNEGVGVRVVITYDGKAQGHRVTIDFLAGIAKLNNALAVPVLS